MRTLGHWHLIRRHCWVGDHHALHRSSWLVAHHALTLGWLLHSYEALEPLLTRQDWLVTCLLCCLGHLLSPLSTVLNGGQGPVLLCG